MATERLLLLLASLALSVAVVASCPSPCQCTAAKVDCTLAGLTEWPDSLPSNTTTLILARNHLQKVTAQDLRKYPLLKMLDLSYNRIERIDRLADHRQLEHLDVSNNLIKELSFLPGFGNLHNLNVAFNRLQELDNLTLVYNTKLQWLSFNGNPIVKLEPGLFRRSEQLLVLSLSGLKIETVPARLLDPLTRLQKLDIRDNSRLEMLQNDIFHYLGNSLRYLNMANNSLTSIPRSLRQLDALRTLNLDYNPFVCNCQLFWFATWLEKRPNVEPSKSMYCSGRPFVESLWRLHCSAVRLETPTLFHEGILGQEMVLKCNFSGNPAPNVTWVTPGRAILRYPVNQTGSVKLVSAGELHVDKLSRSTAGDYSCHASNTLSNVTAFMRINIEPRGFRRVQIQSLIAGFGCVAAFVVVTIIVQGFRSLMDRFGLWEYFYCCGKRLSPRAKQIRTMLEQIEQYKSQQLERLRENYHGQVHRIRENCVQQMDRIHQGYLGQVKYLRGVRDYGTQQLTTIRDQYNDQAKKVYDYTVDRLQTVQRNYVTQRARVRKFSAHQLIRLREKYKFQQKTLNKMMENLPAFYLDSCRSASCARTDSVYFQDGAEGIDVDVVESIIKQGIQLDLPEVCLEDLVVEPLETVVENPLDVAEEPTTSCFHKKTHGRHASAGSLDLSFLFQPIRFPSLSWRRRNTVDEEVVTAVVVEMENTPPIALEVAAEICPVPAEPEASSALLPPQQPADC